MMKNKALSTIRGRLEALGAQIVESPRTIFQTILIVFGVGCLVWVGDTYLEAGLFQMHGNQILQQEIEHQTARASNTNDEPSEVLREDSVVPLNPTPPSKGAVLGKLEVPRLGISVIVAEGTTTDVLEKAVGHVPGTATLCGKGNTAIAGHRDTFFRKLRNIRAGDLIRVTSPLATKQYRVEWTEIVKPTDLDVLSETRQSKLTLVTCYPFRYIGAAPDRFVVRATEVQEQERS